MLDRYRIIERPVITEKALAVNGQRRYVFLVHPEANKIQIRDAVQALFTTPEGEPIVVTDVNTIRTKGKMKRFRAVRRVTVGKTATTKKAIITVAEGQSIQLFEGV
ncbi:MAG: 50S ribosomal protein L23 [Capsulimonadales bacterium]|nr:50S ribosomal protein L23 [Capsulimonadales bacterium]